MANTKKYYKNKQNPNSILVLEPRENISEIDALNWDEITEAEYNAIQEINQHKDYLRATDYVVIKLAEAETNEEQVAIRSEYADVIAERKRVRALINELEEGL